MINQEENKKQSKNVQKTVITKDQWISKGESYQGIFTEKVLFDYFTHDGRHSIAQKFAEECGFQFNEINLSKIRSDIRDSLENGQIDQAISLINDVNVEVLNTNHELFYFLVELKAVEMIHELHSSMKFEESPKELEKIVEFIRDELVPITKKCKSLKKHIDDLMVFFIFNKGKTVFERRKCVFAMVNKAILNKFKIPGNQLVNKIYRMYKEEKQLSQTYIFPKFGSYRK